jgi:hypothetical protein
MDCAKAIREQNGKYLASRPMKIRRSTWKDKDIKEVRETNNGIWHRNFLYHCLFACAAPDPASHFHVSAFCSSLSALLFDFSTDVNMIFIICVTSSSPCPSGEEEGDQEKETRGKPGPRIADSL